MSEAERDKWDARYGRLCAGADWKHHAPSAALCALDPWLPNSGKALDVAGGAGRNAIWLAHRGLDVTLLDISEEGLELARRRAQEAGCVLQTRCQDLEGTPLPEGPWTLIVITHYLNRAVYAAATKVLAPGGYLAVVHPTVTNLERNARPGRQYLLELGELPDLVPDIEILHFEETWQADRHVARLVGRMRT